MHLTDLFPTPIGSFNIGRSTTDTEESFIINQEKIKGSSCDISVDTYVLERPQMDSIKEFILSSLDIYYSSIYSPPEETKLRITQSWLNYQGENGSHHKHYHTNSLISGVFYVKVGIDDNISFYNPRQDTFKIESVFYNQYNSEQMSLPVSEGELVFFPSYLPHSVEKRNADDKQRISLAFNTFIDGTIGSERGLTELILGKNYGKSI